MDLVDLSHPFDAGEFVRSDDDEKKRPHGPQMFLEVRRLHTVEHNGVNTLQISFGNHLGTHVDAPLHLIAGGKSIDQLPLDTYCGSAVVLDLPKGPNGGVGGEDLSAARPVVKAGDIVLIHTGWGDKINAQNYASHHPFLTEGGAHWLVEKRVSMVGMDVQSVDLPHSLREKGFAYTSLRTLLRNGIPAIHNLTNLDRVAGRRVKLFSFPINFKGVDGAPARVVAQLD
jgi:arylformamidase